MARPVAEPPKVVDAARWLWIASALFSLTQTIVDLLDRETLVAKVRERDPNMGQDQVDAAVQGGMVFTLLLAGLIVLLYVKAANRMAQGRNWARIALTVVGLATLLYGVLRLTAYASGVAVSLGAAFTGLDVAFAIVGIGLDGSAIVLMYLPAAAEHFRSRVLVDRSPDQP